MHVRRKWIELKIEKKRKSMMKCNYVRHSESNQTAKQTEENFDERIARARNGTKFLISGFREMKSDFRNVYCQYMTDRNFFLRIVNRCN